MLYSGYYLQVSDSFEKKLLVDLYWDFDLSILNSLIVPKNLKGAFWKFSLRQKSKNLKVGQFGDKKSGKNTQCRTKFQRIGPSASNDFALTPNISKSRGGPSVSLKNSPRSDIFGIRYIRYSFDPVFVESCLRQNNPKIGPFGFKWFVSTLNNLKIKRGVAFVTLKNSPKTLYLVYLIPWIRYFHFSLNGFCECRKGLLYFSKVVCILPKESCQIWLFCKKTDVKAWQ